MLERLVIIALLAAVVLLLGLAVRRIAGRRSEARLGHHLPAVLRDRVPQGSPSLLYFFGPHCPSCRQQARILDGLETDAGIRTLRINAAEERDVAEWFGIATVPSSVVVGADGTVRRVLPGFQPAATLQEWLPEFVLSAVSGTET
jgi:thioredoxin-like negative regulator of GroEL